MRTSVRQPDMRSWIRPTWRNPSASFRRANANCANPQSRFAGKVEAAGIEPASADAPERASTSLSCDFVSPAARFEAPHRRATHPLEVPLRAIGSPSAASPLLAPDSVPRAEDGATSLPNYLGSECEIVLRTCVVPGCFTRPTGDLGLQLIRRTDHVETRSPPDRELYPSLLEGPVDLAPGAPLPDVAPLAPPPLAACEGDFHLHFPVLEVDARWDEGEA